MDIEHFSKEKCEVSNSDTFTAVRLFMVVGVPHFAPVSIHILWKWNAAQMHRHYWMSCIQLRICKKVKPWFDCVCPSNQPLTTGFSLLYTSVKLPNKRPYCYWNTTRIWLLQWVCRDCGQLRSTCISSHPRLWLTLIHVHSKDTVLFSWELILQLFNLKLGWPFFSRKWITKTLLHQQGCSRRLIGLVDGTVFDSW